jgi:hypothetical protein
MNSHEGYLPGAANQYPASNQFGIPACSSDALAVSFHKFLFDRSLKWNPIVLSKKKLAINAGI